MATLFPSRAFRRTKERASGLLFSFGGDDLSTVLTTGQALSLTRATDRTVFDSAGRLAHVGYGCPAWSSVYNAEDGIWEPTLDIQNQSTNLVLRSEDFSAGWSSVGTPIRTSAAATCGDLVLDLLGDDAGGTLEGFTRSVSLTGNTQKGVSVFMKAGTSTTTVVRLRDTTASVTRCQMTIAWSGGVPTVTATTGTDAGTLACYNGVYRFRFQSNSCTAANAHNIEIYPATNASLATTQTGTVYVGGVQVEDFGTPTAYIKTLGSTVTRNKDFYNPTIAFVPQDLTVYGRVVNYVGTNGAFFYLGNGGAGTLNVRNLSGNLQVEVTGSGNVSASRTMPTTSVLEFCAQLGQVDSAPRVRIDSGNGAGFTAWSSTTSVFTSWSVPTLYIGSGSTVANDTSAINSGIRRLVIAPGARTLAEMQGLAV